MYIRNGISQLVVSSLRSVPTAISVRPNTFCQQLNSIDRAIYHIHDIARVEQGVEGIHFGLVF